MVKFKRLKQVNKVYAQQWLERTRSLYIDDDADYTVSVLCC